MSKSITKYEMVLARRAVNYYYASISNLAIAHGSHDSSSDPSKSVDESLALKQMFISIACHRKLTLLGSSSLAIASIEPYHLIGTAKYLNSIKSNASKVVDIDEFMNYAFKCLGDS